MLRASLFFCNGGSRVTAKKSPDFDLLRETKAQQSGPGERLRERERTRGSTTGMGPCILLWCSIYDNSTAQQ